MSGQALPVLYSFRRCPYAMRARMGLASAQMSVELREVALRDKPAEMIAASPKATVPVLVLPEGRVVDESIDIMLFALDVQDTEGLLAADRNAQLELVGDMDETFKPLLDRYKYPNRFPDEPPADFRRVGLDWINQALVPRLADKPYLFGEMCGFADIAVFPFIRQFAHVDRDWFYKTAPQSVGLWLKGHIQSARFGAIMKKHKPWQADEPGILFPVS